MFLLKKVYVPFLSKLQMFVLYLLKVFKKEIFWRFIFFKGAFILEIIAFHARLSTHQKSLQDKEVVVFADVTLNTGNAHNATTGKFSAPVKGHYSFTWTIAIQSGAWFRFSTQLVINGKPISYNHVNGKSHGANWRPGLRLSSLKWRKMTWYRL